MNKNSKTAKKKSSKKFRNLVFAIILLVISIGVSYIYFTAQKYNNIIFPGVKVKEVDLSGKTKEEAIHILTEKHGKELANKNINIKSPNRTYTISYSKLKAKYNIKDTVDEAFSYGKNLNIISKYKLIKRPKIKEYKLKLSYDDKPIDKFISLIAKDINKDPVNASIKMDNGNFKVTSEQLGLQVENKKLKENVISKINEEAEGDLNLDTPIKTIDAKIKSKDLNSINSKLSSFSTNFSTSSEARSNNITVAARSINGTVIMPGDTFSFNEVVGNRTKERGYKEAPVIVNQKLESGLGGGVCQVSSTLYNALIKANIKMTERVHHTFPSTYVEKGLDATVDWGNIDLKFKNTFKFPIYIEAFTENRNLYFNVYSNSSLSKRKYVITTEVYGVIEPKTKYIDDPNLTQGETEVVTRPHTGYRVKVYKNIYENGKFIKKELISNDYYIAINGVIKRGIKKS